jgi:hypothetical protein
METVSTVVNSDKTVLARLTRIESEIGQMESALGLTPMLHDAAKEKESVLADVMARLANLSDAATRICCELETLNGKIRS